MRKNRILRYGIIFCILIFCSCSNSIVYPEIHKEDLIGVWSKNFTKIRTCKAASSMEMIVDTTVYRTSYTFTDSTVVICRNEIIESDCIYVLFKKLPLRWFIKNDSLFTINPYMVVIINSTADSVYSKYSLQWYGDNGLIFSDTSMSDTCFRESTPF